ncbi:hypothetical protein LTR95_002282 [Oleoguttula sp. CCFEE 5521]
MNVVEYAVEHGAWISDLTLYDLVSSPAAEPVLCYLIEKKIVDVNHTLDRWGVMIGFAVFRSRHALVRFLLAHGANPNFPVASRAHKTTLECAAQSSDAEMVKVLLEGGANLGNNGPLCLAAEAGKLPVVEVLIGSGAKVNEMGLIGRDKRSLARLETPLHKAVRNGHADIITVLLGAGADNGIKNVQGQTVIGLAKDCGMEDALM